MLGHLILYILSFVAIWIGAGMSVSSVERLSRRLHLSSFAVSFLVLGFFTSVTELSVGVNSIIEDRPGIYVGNLIGASIVLFMLIIPLLVIFGNDIRINNEFRGMNLVLSLFVIAAPVLLTFDGVVDNRDSLISIVLFGILVLAVQTKRGLLDGVRNLSQSGRTKVEHELIKIVIGVVLIFIAGHFVVEQTVYFSGVLKLSPFLISLLFIAVGTNVPELSIVARSIVMKKNQIAFGDYIGSAAFNTFLFGILTQAYGKRVVLTNSYLVSLFFLVVGLVMFYVFARSKNTLTRKEGLVLLSLYVAFLMTEIYLH